MCLLGCLKESFVLLLIILHVTLDQILSLNFAGDYQFELKQLIRNLKQTCQAQMIAPSCFS